MKLKHHVPVKHLRLTDPVTPEYQREVDQATESAQVRYDKLMRRLAKEEARLDQAKSKPQSKKRRHFVAEQTIVVERGRQELLELHRLMTSHPASTQHTGTKRPHRHINSSEVL